MVLFSYWQEQVTTEWRHTQYKGTLTDHIFIMCKFYWKYRLLLHYWNIPFLLKIPFVTDGRDPVLEKMVNSYTSPLHGFKCYSFNAYLILFVTSPSFYCYFLSLLVAYSLLGFCHWTPRHLTSIHKIIFYIYLLLDILYSRSIMSCILVAVYDPTVNL